MSYTLLIFLAASVSFIAFPFALRFAKKHNIVDNPNARKLQKQPVPVLGSIPVVLGITIPLCIVMFFHDINLLYTLIALIALFIIGLTDDLRDVPAWIRFVLEMLVIWVMIWHPMHYSNGPMIDCMYGLFGREHISLFTALPLSLIAGVGIINAINMIDGVDGYSSGYGILTTTFFAITFFLMGDPISGSFSAICAAALIPFFLHNVFGKSSKMYIGDGGSLLIGLVMVCNVFELLSQDSATGALLQAKGIGVVAFALALLCIPVFDTLRVMCARLIQGISPFTPDKTHLHHLFIDMGFSHAGTSMSILLTNTLIVALWYLSYRLGAAIDIQFFAVVTLGLLATFGFYYGMRQCQKRDNVIWQTFLRIGKWTHFEHKGAWVVIQKIIDWTIIK